MKKFSRFVWAFFLVGASALAAPQKINILAYSSFQGSGSLGNWILKQPNSPCAHLDCHFITPHPSRSLFEELRFNKNRAQEKIDLVIGIDSQQLHWAQEAKIINGAVQLLGESPLAILVHQGSGASPDQTPLKWTELAEKMKSRIIVQDPRYSAIAQAFLVWGQQKKLFSIADFKKMSARVFPKWSASFEYFTQSPNLGLLTFATSQSYNDCHTKSSPTRLLKIEGDSPRYQEWIALVAPTVPTPAPAAAEQLFQFLNTDAFQKAVPEFNWLISSKGLDVTPPCFRKTAFSKSTAPSPIRADEYQKWMDEWAL